MKSSNSQIVFFLVFLLTFASVGFCAEGMADVNDVFKVGDLREIEVAVPKRGFIGAPPTPAAKPAGLKGIPQWDEDFRKRYVRITVLDKRKLKEGIRVILRLDEIDPNGAIVMDHSRSGPSRPRQALYYACLDVRSGSCRILGLTEPVEKDKWGHEPDVGNGVLNRAQRYGLPFPLVMTVPPALSPDGSLKESGWMRFGNGVAYTSSVVVKKESGEYQKIQASLIREVHPQERPGVRFYSQKDKSLSSEKTEDSIQVAIIAQETQMWKKDTNWLWETMERIDGKGNITLRCRKFNAKLETLDE